MEFAACVLFNGAVSNSSYAALNIRWLWITKDR